MHSRGKRDGKMRKLIFMAMAALLLFLVACSKEEDKSAEEPAKETATEKETEPEPESIYPLTGIGTDAEIDNRMVAVMINNHPAARPQSGLSDADIVFEILSEGTITRFLALFHSEMPEVVGPVRSAREYYFHLAEGYDAIYVYHGAANFVDAMIAESGSDFLNGSSYDNDGNLFKRESFRVAPHNSYLQLGSVYGVAEGKGFEVKGNYEPLPFLSSEEAEMLTGEAAGRVTIAYSASGSDTVEYAYNEANGKFSRLSDGVPSAELDTEEPIEADNVLIAEAYHEVIDGDGRRKVDLESGGNAYLLQKGTIQEVQWENRDGRIVPVKDGEPIGFVPGKTWINVVPDNPGIQQSVTISN